MNIARFKNLPAFHKRLIQKRQLNAALNVQQIQIELKQEQLNAQRELQHDQQKYEFSCEVYRASVSFVHRAILYLFTLNAGAALAIMNSRIFESRLLAVATFSIGALFSILPSIQYHFICKKYIEKSFYDGYAHHINNNNDEFIIHKSQYIILIPIITFFIGIILLTKEMYY